MLYNPKLYAIIGTSSPKGMNEMKKHIAMILALVLIMSLAACGGKKNEAQNPAAGGNETVSQTEGTQAATDSTAEATEGTQSAATEATDPDENQITATTPKDDASKDDIKIPVDGDTDVPVETPDDGASSDNVIAFDDLLSVS